ncbi:MAG: ATP-binding protein [Myxococcales bacterium]|nr:ATP-binding protein [Myxococcales bacterium]
MVESRAKLIGPISSASWSGCSRQPFPDRRFADCEPRYVSGLPTPDDYYFMLADGERTYDLEEMSAGEQAIFPFFYDFVRQQIGQSVVLIDEIDLNLHPPLAQTLPRCSHLSGAVVVSL